jgi:para-aminobenzoate synthetase component 1
MALGIYHWALLFDHQQQRGYLLGTPPEQALQRLKQPLSSALPATFQLHGALHSDLQHADYLRAFTRIQRYLRDGDCYQVNLTRRFHARVSGDPWQAYLALRQHSPAPYGAYLSTPFGQLLCNSPEQFIEVDKGAVNTRPIKGTRPRHPDPHRDQQLADELQHSIKDRAENVMIVDLLRNDLGRVCKPGSVRVEQLWQLHSFATVHHLISTISGQLTDANGALDLLRAAFPGGSVSGAPKHRAMQIIRELEPVPRGVYCGSIGYLDWNGRMDSNITIRTLIHQQGQLQFHAGGGIVIDSEMQQEYQETLDKAAAMLWLLGQN